MQSGLLSETVEFIQDRDVVLIDDRNITSIERAPARAVANFHTGFNLVLALLFFLTLTPYAKFLTRWLPERINPDSPGAPRYLENVAGDISPTVALAGATREALRLAELRRGDDRRAP